MEANEPPEVGALREAKEETGLDMKIICLLGVYHDQYGKDGEYTLNLHYITEIIGGEMKAQDDLADLEWVDIYQVPLDQGFQNTRDGLRDLQKWYGLNKDRGTHPTIVPIQFKDITDLPEVHSDARRTIYEKIVKTKDGMRRISRSVVNADEAIMGNHYHDFTQNFRGRGEGVLYTAPRNDPTKVNKQMLPADGWSFTIPEGMIMALRLKKGAVQIFESNKDYQDGANTHRVIIAP